MRRRFRFPLLTAGLAITAVSGLVGCDSPERDTDLAGIDEAAEPALYTDDMRNEILGDLTPELLTLSSRPVDAQADIARRFDTDIRMFFEDWGKVLMFNRNSRLNRRPLP